MKLYLKMMAMLMRTRGCWFSIGQKRTCMFDTNCSWKMGMYWSYMYFFFFNIRWSWERQWKIGVDFLFAFGTHSEAQVCGEKITGVDVKLLIWFQWFAAKKNCQRRTTTHNLISVNYNHKMSYDSHFPRVIIERLCWNFRDASIRQNKMHLTAITQKKLIK